MALGRAMTHRDARAMIHQDPHRSKVFKRTSLEVPPKNWPSYEGSEGQNCVHLGPAQSLKSPMIQE